MSKPGLYVEIEIARPIEDVWRLTQQPDLHQRWDLRFTEIEYLPRPDPAQPQHFLYATRIGFGIAIRGTGESLGERVTADGSATSALKFFSADPKSLIRHGSGYWRYVPTPAGTRFFTWYDYTTRFGLAGRLADLVFRPLMGWATAWSFDRLRLWIERDQTPETSLAFAAIHTVARCTIASIWIWHGLVPKLLFHHVDEQIMLAQSHVPVSLLTGIGAAEVVFGFLILATSRYRSMLLFNAALMVAATVAVAHFSPAYLKAAFNPVTLNLGVIALSVTGWLAAPYAPTARRCLRRAKEMA